MTGEPCERPDSSPEVQGILFDLIARTADSSVTGSGRFTTQWRFTDADPWHIVVENGSTRAAPGLAGDPDLTLGTDWSEWVGIAMKQGNPLRSLAGRRLRPNGSPRALNTFRRVFAPH